MASVVTGKNEIFAKQIEVKATGASDVKIYANGASQKTSGVDITDNSSNNTCLPGGCVKPKGNNPKNVSIFPLSNSTKKESPFGRFDINNNGKLDTEELAAMQAYLKALASKKPKNDTKIDKNQKMDNDKQNLLMLLITLLIGELLKQNNNDLGQNKGKNPNPALLNIA